MLSKEKRLTKTRDFERIYQKGKRLSSESFNLNYGKNRTEVTRVGIVVGKKFSKKATERNRVKRVFREAINELYKDLKTGMDIVVFVKTNKSEIKLEKIKKELFESFKKVGFLK